MIKTGRVLKRKSFLKRRVKELEAVLRKCRKDISAQVWGLRKTNEGIRFLYKDLEKKTEKLLELDRLKSQFVFNVSHDLRTPISIIKGNIFMILDGAAGAVNSGQKEFLNGAMKSTDHLARMIDDILDFQKSGAKDWKLKTGENDLNELAREVCVPASVAAKKKGLKFSLKLGRAPLKARFDKEQISHVLANLLSNAVKFTAKGGISVRAAGEGKHVHISVSDTGCGVKKEDIPRLFQPFERIGERKKEGTGLGLAISRTIVEKHRGSIWAESGLGKGSVFYFTVPRNGLSYGI